jgi:1-pyrroline-5-carboxylate dehydrogenase
MAGVVGFNGTRRVPRPVNEPVRSYAPGSPERSALKARLDSMAGDRAEIPIIIGGVEHRTGDLGHSVMPHDHEHVLADYHKGTPQHVEQAIAAAREAQREWANWP